MFRLLKDGLNVAEIPPIDSTFRLNSLLGLIILFAPLLEHLNARVNVSYSHLWSFLLEDCTDVNLITHFLANFVGNGRQNLLEFVVVVINVA